MLFLVQLLPEKCNEAQSNQEKKKIITNHKAGKMGDIKLKLSQIKEANNSQAQGQK